jgi:DnaK suppressor protein
MKSEVEVKFLKMFDEILAATNINDLTMLAENGGRGDQADLVTHEMEKLINLRLNGRNDLFVKRIKGAREKILNGSFGTCEECGCDISEKRLMARPMAKLCIDCKEVEERNERGSIEGRRDLVKNNVLNLDSSHFGEQFKTTHGMETISIQNMG